MFLKNFLLISNASKLSRWSALALTIQRYRHRYGRSLYNKTKSRFQQCEDVERGLKQQYIHSKTQHYNNNENEVKSDSRNDLLNLGNSEHTGSNSVNSRLGLKIVASLIVIASASFIAYYMDNLIYALIAFAVATLILLFISGYWKWFYIAALTGPRDLMWVYFVVL